MCRTRRPLRRAWLALPLLCAATLGLGLASRAAAASTEPGAAPPPTAVAETPATPCTLVFGHGRNPPVADAEGQPEWDEVNRAFASQVAVEIAERDIRTVLVLAPAALIDVALIVGTLTEHARREACDRVLETALFAEDADLLVVRLREYPIVGSGESLRIGQARYTSRQEFPNTQRNRDRLAPAALGKSFAHEYLEQRLGPRP